MCSAVPWARAMASHKLSPRPLPPPALARLLKTDPNTLMCFRESLTREEMAKEMNEVARISQEEGVEAAVDRVRDLAEEYPSCGELLYQLATTLRGLVILRTAGD